jgi:hypothetical protein
MNQHSCFGSWTTMPGTADEVRHQCSKDRFHAIEGTPHLCSHPTCRDERPVEVHDVQAAMAQLWADFGQARGSEERREALGRFERGLPKLREAEERQWMEDDARQRLEEELRHEARFSRLVALGRATDPPLFILHPGLGSLGTRRHWEGPLCADESLTIRVDRGEVRTTRVLEEPLPPAWTPGRFFIWRGPASKGQTLEVTALVTVDEAAGLECVPDNWRERARSIAASRRQGADR